MKRIAHLSFIATVVLLLAMTHFTFSSSAQPATNFAYLVTTVRGADILVIDVNNPDAMAIRRNYPIPEGWSMTRQAFISPNGEWIATALLSNDQQLLKVQLYEFSSGEIYDVVEGAISTNGRNIAWSPDSHYLAFNIAQNTNNFNTVVYSVIDGSLRRFTSDNTDHFDIGWSPTSTHLATFSKLCDEGTTCLGQLEMFNVVNGLQEESIDLPMSFGNSIACGLTISPDLMQIAFVARCASEPEIATDVYIWNTNVNNVEQITYLFAEAPNSTPVWAAYNLAWLDHQDLLIGLDYQLFTQPEANQLMTYNSLQNNITILSTMAGTAFAVNPYYEQVAVLSESSTSSFSTPNTGQLVILSTSEITEITDGLSRRGVDASFNAPLGCDLTWSPDGSLLSYVTYTNDCKDEITGFVFVDPATEVSHQHMITLDGITDNNVIITAGWISE